MKRMLRKYSGWDASASDTSLELEEINPILKGLEDIPTVMATLRQIIADT